MELAQLLWSSVNNLRADLTALELAQLPKSLPLTALKPTQLPNSLPIVTDLELTQLPKSLPNSDGVDLNGQ